MRTRIFLFISSVIRSLPDFVRTPARFVVNSIRILAWWLSADKVPPPYAYKIFTLMFYAMRYKTSIFVETGTYMGDTIDSLRNIFDDLYSIELDDSLFRRARNYFKNSDKIKILHGDSAKVLPVLLKKLNKPILFWLDAHYSGEGTARGENDTPIMKELSSILKHIQTRPVILIDDARLFNGKDSYPKLRWFISYARKNWKDYNILVKYDVIRIFPL